MRVRFTCTTSKSKSFTVLSVGLGCATQHLPRSLSRVSMDFDVRELTGLAQVDSLCEFIRAVALPLSRSVQLSCNAPTAACSARMIRCATRSKIKHPENGRQVAGCLCGRNR